MKYEYLKLIAEHDGQLDWYRIASYRMNDPIVYEGRLMELINDLLKSELIQSIDGAPHPKYKITEKGRRLMAQHSK